MKPFFAILTSHIGSGPPQHEHWPFSSIQTLHKTMSAQSMFYKKSRHLVTINAAHAFTLYDNISGVLLNKCINIPKWFKRNWLVTFLRGHRLSRHAVILGFLQQLQVSANAIQHSQHAGSPSFPQQRQDSPHTPRCCNKVRAKHFNYFDTCLFQHNQNILCVYSKRNSLTIFLPLNHALWHKKTQRISILFDNFYFQYMYKCTFVDQDRN